ncbi:MAG: hypothetical protein ABI866_09005 [Dokdonella sp.]
MPVRLDALEGAAIPGRDSPPPRSTISSEIDNALDAARWARLKDHLSDLALLTPEHRNTALENLDLEEDDRRWLKVLAKPLLSGDRRLSI